MDGRAFLDAVSTGSLIRGSRSTVLQPLGWLATILLPGVLGSVYFEAPDWLVAFFAMAFGVTFVVYIATYVYLVFTHKDALRSESYALQKLQIENAVLGDSETGFKKTIEGERTTNPNLPIGNVK